MSRVPWSRSLPGLWAFFLKVFGSPSECLVEIDGAGGRLVYDRRVRGSEGGGWRSEVGGWRLEDGGWRTEVGGRRLEDGGWRLGVPLGFGSCVVGTCQRRPQEVSRAPSLSSDRSSQTSESAMVRIIG